MKQVRETKAGKSISAYVILNHKAEHVATVQVHYSNAGTVTVDVWHEDGNTLLQQGRATGYGYDKFAAALDGLSIDGHKMSNHCGVRLDLPEAGGWSEHDKAPVGFRFANWSTEKNLWTSCFRRPGLEYLTALGYRVIQAL